MRPEILFGAFASVTSLPGIGPRLGKLVEKAAGPHVVDLYWHLPTGLIDRRFMPTVATAPASAVATLAIEVVRHRPPPGRRLPYKVVCRDATGTIDLVFFHAFPDYLERMLPLGATRLVSGKIEAYDGRVQMTHPDYIAPPEDAGSLAAVEPVYGLTAGLHPRVLGKAVRYALDRAPDLPEWLAPELKARHGWSEWREALRAAHAPQEETDLLPASLPRCRLAYDELLANQLALGLVRLAVRRGNGRRVAGDGRLRRRLLAALPYKLTLAQRSALAEIDADMAKPAPMMRLLQGDVGSGKTVVALLAMLSAVEAGHQAALMVPTEILARQHLATLGDMASGLGVRIALLTGRNGSRARSKTLAALASGTVDLLIGTHALFQDEVAFRDLALAVIDEQHRFGVHQRLALTAKGVSQPGGGRPDVLLMTATPIPRSLTLTIYGDTDVSRITELPPGRKPVVTRAVPNSRLGDVLAGIARTLARGSRAYWVCPLVGESAAVDLAAVEERFRDLDARFPGRVAMVHGQMKAAERDQAMQSFVDGRAQLLVATTVIEVGVDVPEATVIVVEHAERFGLAQLHQLRGRVGRGPKRSSCVLLYAAPLTDSARARLNILRETNDGFRIAEEDLRLRGSGELLGTRQSGLPEFRLADLDAHADLLAVARDDARLVLDRDPALSSPRGQALRVLLYLFERDAAIRNIRSG